MAATQAFDLSEQQNMFRSVMREFAAKEITPIASILDSEDRIPDLMVLVKKIGDLGALGLTISEEYGGSGGDYISKVIAAEEICYASSSMGAVCLCSMSFGCYPIYKYASEEIRRRFVPPLARGEKLCCGCFTEPNAGSDLGGLETRAMRQGDYYMISGNKVFITNAEESRTAVILASTNKELGHRGLSMFVLDKDTPGFNVVRREHKMGLRGVSTCEISFDNLKVPASQVLGMEGQGFSIVLDVIDACRVEVAAQAVGVARAAFDAALDYSGKRVQFGRAISGFQFIQGYLADMATNIDAARLLTYRAASLQDAGSPFAKEACMAKLFASEMADHVCNKAIQIHGGYGYVSAYPVERYWRDVRASEIYEGTSEQQRLTIARFLRKS